MKRPNMKANALSEMKQTSSNNSRVKQIPMKNIRIAPQNANWGLSGSSAHKKAVN